MSLKLAQNEQKQSKSAERKSSLSCSWLSTQEVDTDQLTSPGSTLELRCHLQGDCTNIRALVGPAPMGAKAISLRRELRHCYPSRSG